MGLGPSKFFSKGSLKGAYAPPLPGIVLPPKMDPKLKTYKATVPRDKRPGDKMIFEIDGKEIAISIPRGKKPGEKFQFEYGNRERVIASTLPALPGATIVEAKPMIFANVSHAFYRNNLNDQHEQTSMSQVVGSLMQEAQTMLLQQTVENGCNAVLSINCNISTDSTGEHGRAKFVVVTLIGTPCVVMPSNTMPTVTAQASVLETYSTY